jgi:hypothetical protein
VAECRLEHETVPSRGIDQWKSRGVGCTDAACFWITAFWITAERGAAARRQLSRAPTLQQLNVDSCANKRKLAFKFYFVLISVRTTVNMIETKIYADPNHQQTETDWTT